ncbi:hypothetical protein V6Z94_001825 [Aspergillus fumigatus]
MANLILVAFHACMGTFAASGIIPGYSIIAEDFGVSINKASYLTSLQIAILGGAPLFWKPLSQRYGRRPIFLLSLMCSCVCNIGCAKSTNYASVAACRALQAFFISPASAIGSAIVMETTFKKDRAKYMGIWTLMVTVGIPCGPFIFGFVAHRAGYVWIYWVLAMVSWTHRPHSSPAAIDLHHRSMAVSSFCTSSSGQKPATSAATKTRKSPPGNESTFLCDESI